MGAMNISTHTIDTHMTPAAFAKRAAVAAAALAIGLAASACGGPPHPAAAPFTAPQLQTLIPTPANTQRADGPNTVADNGIHMHFLVNGSAPDVLKAYKSDLEADGWSVTVVSSGGWGPSGGATYTATRGDIYGVFSGGGDSGGTSDVGACAWPSKPVNPNCGGGTHG